jgi:hypothetical protein
LAWEYGKYIGWFEVAICDLKNWRQFGPTKKAGEGARPPYTILTNKDLGDAYFGVGSENFAEGFADFAYRRIGPHRVHDVRHGIG